MRDGLDMALQEIAAPQGWTAALLTATFPLGWTDAGRYREAIDALIDHITASSRPGPEEIFLLLERCRPAEEIKTLIRNGRSWQPETGVGVWLDREPPTTWTPEEFEAAAPGELRPLIDRVMRISRRPEAQKEVWNQLSGSGAMIRLWLEPESEFLDHSTERLLPTIRDESLTSFPFYLPLLRANTLREPAAEYDSLFAELLVHVNLYVKESPEDGGLFLLLRKPAGPFWQTLERAQMPFPIRLLAEHDR